jgi:hypothetical protein
VTLRWLCCLTAAIACAVSVPAAAQGTPRAQRPNVLDLKLGTPADKLPVMEFMDYACGTNGGPPATALEDWTEFKRCRPEATGLREVYFRYDDQLEYEARARRQETQIPRYAGTKIFNRSVILGALFDEAGVMRGLRVTSDPRATLDERKESFALSNFLRARYGEENFRCRDLPPDEGETPLGGQFVKQQCEATYNNEFRIYLDTHFFRKAGQAEFAPGTRELTLGQFESGSRFEIYELSVPRARP